MYKGSMIIDHLHAMQNNYAIDCFIELILTHQPKRILEIGTFHGGLTAGLRQILDNLDMKDIWIRTYDTADQTFLKDKVKSKKLSIDVRTKNLFDYSYLEWKNEETKEEIKQFVEQEGATMVLCDGGCKRCEFNLIAPFLKAGDAILAHDYAPNPEYFKEHIEGKYWGWLEIEDKHVASSCERYNLVPYKQELMQKAAWMSKIKAS